MDDYPDALLSLEGGGRVLTFFLPLHERGLVLAIRKHNKRLGIRLSPRQEAQLRDFLNARERERVNA